MYQYYAAKYEKEKTLNPFEEHGSTWILAGCYDLYLKEWLKYFRPNQIHIIDGDLFITNPVFVLKRLEDFLGLQQYFDESKFVFDTEKGFFCKKYEDGRKECMKKEKGRAHPHVNEELLSRIRDLYRPHNKEFMKLSNMTLNWL